MTVKALRALAKDYGLPRRLNYLLQAIAEVYTAGFIKRLQRAVKTKRFSAIRRDVENPHKKGRRDREVEHC